MSATIEAYNFATIENINYKAKGHPPGDLATKRRDTLQVIQLGTPKVEQLDTFLKGLSCTVKANKLDAFYSCYKTHKIYDKKGSGNKKKPKECIYKAVPSLLNFFWVTNESTNLAPD